MLWNLYLVSGISNYPKRVPIPWLMEPFLAAALTSGKRTTPLGSWLFIPFMSLPFTPSEFGALNESPPQADETQ